MSDAFVVDGDCIIDIDYVGSVGTTDLETYQEIGRAAELIIFDCVFAPGGVGHGGVAAGLGVSGGFPNTEKELNIILRCTRRTQSDHAAILPQRTVLASHEAK